MRVDGIDFTSRPNRRKPITCLECVLDGQHLRAGRLSLWQDFAAFEAALQRPGPWIAGIDFSFGQARRFIETIGWPRTWTDYVDHAESLGREGFRAALDAYRADRPLGDKEHRRATDRAAGSISPQKLYGTPVGLMFFEGAPRLVAAGVTIPGLQAGRSGADRGRGLSRRPGPHPDWPTRLQAGHQGQTDPATGRSAEGPPPADHRRRDDQELRIERAAPQRSLAEDPSGDQLDALLCAIQAAWAWTRRAQGFGAPTRPRPPGRLDRGPSL